MLRLVWCICVCLCLGLPVQGQEMSWRCKRVLADSAWQALDTLAWVQESLRLSPARSDIHWIFHPSKALFRLVLPTAGYPDSLTLCYRVLPAALTQRTEQRSQAVYDSGGYRAPVLSVPTGPIGPPRQREELFSSPGLQKTGSISRGISVGNAQNVFVNSALNLQLDGKLSDDLHLTAVISDQHIPYQPEGNTQQIQELDRVFLRLTHRYATLTGGDIVLRNGDSQFLRYYKNVQGGQLETSWRDSLRQLSAKTTAAIAVAKGQFRSQALTALEGVSGPYRLTGPNGERAIIVLANSERVFLDGRLLERGFGQDYIIDYNAAEVTFMPRVLITQYSRLRVDFEYTLQAYSRSILTASHVQDWKNHRVGLQFYREQDNPDSPLLQSLTEADRRLLADIGDDLSRAVAPSAVRVNGFSTNVVLYTSRDTLTPSGGRYTFWQRATARDTAWYTVTFSEVGQGRGHYRAGSAATNGRAFEWVEPIGGVPQGSFEPVRLLVAPNRRQMASISLQNRWGAGWETFAEMAFSQYDQNRYSSRDAADDGGSALKAGIRQKGQPLGQKGWKWSGQADFEYDQAHFNAIDRFRSIEFDRDWSLNPTGTRPPAPAADHIGQAELALVRGQEKLSWQSVRRLRSGAVDGWQHQMQALRLTRHLRLSAQGFWMQSSLADTRTQWQRARFEVMRRGKGPAPGYAFSADQNRVWVPSNDSIVSTAMYFGEHSFFVQQGDSAKARFRAEYGLRDDFAPQAGRLLRATRARTASLSIDRRRQTDLYLLTLTYRELDQLIGQEGTTATVLGRAEWNQSFAQKALRSELAYNVSSGRELRREFVYLQVPPGQGTHTWRDDNGDGQQQLTEFYPAVNADERNYARFFVPTTEYIAAFSTQAAYRFNAEAPRAWSAQTAPGWLRMLARFSLNIAAQVQRRTTSEAPAERFSPWGAGDAASVLSDRSNLRGTLFFDRKNADMGAELRIVRSSYRQVLTGGFEARETAENALLLRRNLGQYLNVRLEGQANLRGSGSDFLTGRSYRIGEEVLSSELAWQPNNEARASIGAVWKAKRNLSGPETTGWREATLGLRWAKSLQQSVQANLRLISIQYTGEANAPIGYDMLEALRPGQNAVWSLQWMQRLANGLQLTLSYNGRSAEQVQAVHVGRVQVTALF